MRLMSYIHIRPSELQNENSKQAVQVFQWTKAMILIFTQKCLLLRLAKCKIGELQYTHVKSVPGIQIMETVLIAKCK